MCSTPHPYSLPTGPDQLWAKTSGVLTALKNYRKIYDGAESTWRRMVCGDTRVSKDSSPFTFKKGEEKIQDMIGNQENILQ